MSDDVNEPRGLARIWDFAVLPLLVEYHVGTDVDVTARFGLDAIKAHLSAGTGPASPVADEHTDTP